MDEVEKVSTPVHSADSGTEILAAKYNTAENRC